jgi:tripartite-type tricarboxylate transporter receptor subunit TctC
MNSNRHRRRELFRLFSATCLSTAGFAVQSQHTAQAQGAAQTPPVTPTGSQSGSQSGSPSPAPVDKYPTRPITLVVPQTPGGTNDIVGRVVAQKLSDVTGTSVIVENRPGAGGNIGTQAVARGSKDGYTLLLTVSSAQAINPALYKNAGFDPVKDFTPVTLIGSVPNVLVVHPSFPARSLDEFLALVRSKPESTFQYASAGNGTLNHLLGEMMNQMTKTEVQHIPYKGVAQALNDLLGGQVPIAFASVPSVLQHIKAGKLVALGVSSAKRSPVLPDTPAIAEKIPGFSGTLWIGLFAPAGAPRAALTQLEAHMGQVQAAPEFKEKLLGSGVELASATPTEFANLLRDDLATWARIVKTSGARVD